MSDFKNLFKITIKRYGIWILLISMLIAMANGLQTRARLSMDSKNLKDAVGIMAEDLDLEIDNDQKISKSYLDEASEISNQYAKKYGIKTMDEVTEMTSSQWDDYSSKGVSKSGQAFWDYEAHVRTFESIVEANVDGTMGSGAYLEDSVFGMLILVTILSVLITSLEQSQAFYDFTLMFPWKKKDEVWMKALVVFIIGLLIFFISFFMNIFMIEASDFGPLLDISNLGNTVLQSILLILATSIISVATGMIAGNFLGHGGLLIIAIGSIELIKLLIDAFVNIFSPELVNSTNQVFWNFKDNLPEIFKPFFGLINVRTNYQSIFGYLIVAILWAILAYLINNKQSSEKAGYMITSRPVESIAKLLAVLSFTTILFTLGSATLEGISNPILQLIIYALSLLISIKLFDILFKVRLKF